MLPIVLIMSKPNQNQGQWDCLLFITSNLLPGLKLGNRLFFLISPNSGSEVVVCFGLIPGVVCVVYLGSNGSMIGKILKM